MSKAKNKAVRSVAAQVRGGDTIFEFWLLAAALCWWIGITEPVLNVTKLYLFDETVSLTSAIQTLWTEGEVLLAGIVAAFTLVFPVLKLLGLWLGFRLSMDRPSVALATRIVSVTGKWSMLDVFVIALIIVMLKGSWIADAETGIGLYLFFAAVVLTMVATMHLGWMQNRVRDMNGEHLDD